MFPSQQCLPGGRCVHIFCLYNSIFLPSRSTTTVKTNQLGAFPSQQCLPQGTLRYTVFFLYNSIFLPSGSTTTVKTNQWGAFGIECNGGSPTMINQLKAEWQR
jgi:hypothetical protein